MNKNQLPVGHVDNSKVVSKTEKPYGTITGIMHGTGKQRVYEIKTELNQHGRDLLAKKKP